MKDKPYTLLAQNEAKTEKPMKKIEITSTISGDDWALKNPIIIIGVNDENKETFRISIPANSFNKKQAFVVSEDTSFLEFYAGDTSEKIDLTNKDISPTKIDLTIAMKGTTSSNFLWALGAGKQKRLKNVSIIAKFIMDEDMPPTSKSSHIPVFVFP